MLSVDLVQQATSAASARDEDGYVELPFGGERNARVSVVGARDDLPCARFTLDKTIVRVAARVGTP